MVQVVEHLTSKGEALNSNPSPASHNKKVQTPTVQLSLDNYEQCFYSTRQQSRQKETNQSYFLESLDLKNDPYKF
jgi:hypothetical protein